MKVRSSTEDKDLNTSSKLVSDGQHRDMKHLSKSP